MSQLTSIDNCLFGREVKWQGEAPASLRDALHDYGMLLFRNVPGDSSSTLAAQVRDWFPDMPIEEPRANRPVDGGPMTVLGSTRGEDGGFNADYVPAARTGAALLSESGQWDDALEESTVLRLSSYDFERNCLSDEVIDQTLGQFRDWSQPAVGSAGAGAGGGGDWARAMGGVVAAARDVVASGALREDDPQAQEPTRVIRRLYEQLVWWEASTVRTM